MSGIEMRSTHQAEIAAEFKTQSDCRNSRGNTRRIQTIRSGLLRREESIYPRDHVSRSFARRSTMQRPKVFIIGKGCRRGSSYKVTEGLLAKYGPKQVRDTPIAEAGMIGVGVGKPSPVRPIVGFSC
jgi:hypothetical protein